MSAAGRAGASAAGQRAHVVVDGVHVVAEQTEHAEPDARAVVERAQEVVTIDEADLTVRPGRGRAVVIPMADDRAQGQHLPGFSDAERFHVAIPRREQEIDLPRLQDVDPTGSLAFAEDRLTRPDLQQPFRIRKRRFDNRLVHASTIEGVAERLR